MWITYAFFYILYLKTIIRIYILRYNNFVILCFNNFVGKKLGERVKENAWFRYSVGDCW